MIAIKDIASDLATSTLTIKTVAIELGLDRCIYKDTAGDEYVTVQAERCIIEELTRNPPGGEPDEITREMQTQGTWRDMAKPADTEREEAFLRWYKATHPGDEIHFNGKFHKFDFTIIQQHKISKLIEFKTSKRKPVKGQPLKLDRYCWGLLYIQLMQIPCIFVFDFIDQPDDHYYAFTPTDELGGRTATSYGWANGGGKTNGNPVVWIPVDKLVLMAPQQLALVK